MTRCHRCRKWFVTTETERPYCDACAVLVRRRRARQSRLRMIARGVERQ